MSELDEGELLEDIGQDDNKDLGSPRIRETPEGEGQGGFVFGAGITYRDTLQRNNPNLHMEMGENPMWDFREYDDVLEDDEQPTEDDPTCSTILLTA